MLTQSPTILIIQELNIYDVKLNIYDVKLVTKDIIYLGMPQFNGVEKTLRYLAELRVTYSQHSVCVR